MHRRWIPTGVALALPLVGLGLRTSKVAPLMKKLSSISTKMLELEGRIEDGQYVPEYLSATVAAEHGRLRGPDNRPIVVLNACQSGRAGYSLTGLGGFAQSFLLAGAGMFIGTLWSVGDTPARTFTGLSWLSAGAGRRPSSRRRPLP